MSADHAQPAASLDRGDGGCPCAVELAAFVDGGLTADRHAAILAHVERCDRCAAVAGAVASTAEQPPAAPLAPDLLLRAAALAGRQRSRFSRTVVPLFAAAACLVLAAVLWKPMRHPANDVAPSPAVSVAPPVAPDDVRSPGDGPVPTLLQPSPGQLHAMSVPFVWTRVPGAAFYEVRVTTSDGDTIWTSTTDATHVTWDGRARRPGARYFAWVSATMADDRRVTSSIIALQDGVEP